MDPTVCPTTTTTTTTTTTSTTTTTTIYGRAMLGKEARILFRICDLILGLVTKRHKKSKHNLHRSEKYF